MWTLRPFGLLLGDLLRPVPFRPGNSVHRNSRWVVFALNWGAHLGRYLAIRASVGPVASRARESYFAHNESHGLGIQSVVGEDGRRRVHHQPGSSGGPHQLIASLPGGPGMTSAWWA